MTGVAICGLIGFLVWSIGVIVVAGDDDHRLDYPKVFTALLIFTGCPAALSLVLELLSR